MNPKRKPRPDRLDLERAVWAAAYALELDKRRDPEACAELADEVVETLDNLGPCEHDDAPWWRRAARW